MNNLNTTIDKIALSEFDVHYHELSDNLKKWCNLEVKKHENQKRPPSLSIVLIFDTLVMQQEYGLMNMNTSITEINVVISFIQLYAKIVVRYLLKISSSWNNIS